MALTKVSPSLFQVSNNITSTTVGGSANTISLTFDSNGVITGASNNALSVANTLITGNIVSSQIAPDQTLNGNLSVSGTGFLKLPSGTTAQRPTGVTGYTRFNTTTGVAEYYDGTSWISLTASPYVIDYLIVAGGGAGGDWVAGGGGAGGYITGTGLFLNPTSTYSIVVGAGGASNFGGHVGNPGANSSAFSLTAIGGGGGGTYGSPTGQSGASGGSGGGGGVSENGPAPSGGSGTSGQGNAGGAGGNRGGTGPYPGCGGGGGAGAVGNTYSGTTAGAGGVGLNWQSVGTYYAGGGGGASNAGTAGAGGTGGGGAGATGSANATAGTTNTGGGGGGCNGGSANSGAGGSGVVIIRYLGNQKGSGGTVTSAGGYTYHTFTSSTTYTA